MAYLILLRMSIPDCSNRTFLTKVRGMEIFSVLAWIRSCRMWAFFMTLGQRVSAASTMDSSKSYSGTEDIRTQPSGNADVNTKPSEDRTVLGCNQGLYNAPRRFVMSGWLVNRRNLFRAATWQDLRIIRASEVVCVAAELDTRPGVRRIKHSRSNLLHSDLL